MKRARHDLAKEAVRRAQTAWGRSAWFRLSERERKEKVATEFMSMVVGWTLPSLTPEQREVAQIARDIYGILDDADGTLAALSEKEAAS